MNVKMNVTIPGAHDGTADDFISHLSYHPANEPKEDNVSARLHASVHQ